VNRKRVVRKRIILQKSTVKDFINLFRREFKVKFGYPYFVNWRRDGAITKKLLSVFPFNELVLLTKEFFDSNPNEYLKSRGYTISTFLSEVNRLSVDVGWENKERRFRLENLRRLGLKS